ncbi:MAG: uroporphyrinogen decarboxylase family protein [Armatimonadota bacterium]
MQATTPFTVDITPDWHAMRACILRRGTPKRVHFIELFLDGEVQQAIADRYELLPGVTPDDPVFTAKRSLAVQRFLGYDYIRFTLDDFTVKMHNLAADDTAGENKKAARYFVDESKGPITTWEEFETYPWPEPEKASTRSLEWLEEHLPEGMCIIASGGLAHFFEWLSFFMGYETLCYALYDQRDLVKAIADRILEINTVMIRRLLQFERVKFIWGSDDLGFRSGTLISPEDMREFVLPGHKLLAQISHDAGRPYLLHSCGKLDTIMDDLIEDVKIDAKHSFEDTIESVVEVKETYGRRIGLLGGIDVDFLCRADEAAVRRRVRDTLDRCLPGGGYLLGTGNSVANYVPLENYFALLDEGRKFSG